MPKSDVFMLVPAHYETLVNLPENNIITANAFQKTMTDVTAYELVGRFCKDIVRYQLEDLTLPIRDDALSDSTFIGEVKAQCLISVIKTINLVSVCLYINEYEDNITVLLDQISREDIQVKKDNHIQSLDLYLEEAYGIIKNGEAKICLTQNTKASHKNRMYYLAAESNCSEALQATITSKKLSRYANQNLAVYDFSEIYVSGSVVYQVYADYDKKPEDRLYHESLLVFILELLVFQLAAINRTNKQVENVLKTQKQLKIQKVKALLSEYARTMALWEAKLFRYPNTQNIYDQIRSRFDLKMIQDTFRYNHQHLHELVHVRNVHNSLIESKILFFIAIVLFSKEVYQLALTIHQRSFTEYFSKPFAWVTSISSLLIIVVILLYLKRRDTETT